ncbi:MAG: hypothetical protein AAF561_04960 [Planctomycetota bacterium]
MQERIDELLDLGIDRRTPQEQRELEELLALAPSTLDPYPTLVQTPYGLQDTNGVDVTIPEEHLYYYGSPRPRQWEPATE